MMLDGAGIVIILNITMRSLRFYPRLNLDFKISSMHHKISSMYHNNEARVTPVAMLRGDSLIKNMR